MPKLLLVARNEYLTQVRKRSFLFSTLGVPLLIIVVMAISIVASLGSSDRRPVGYVDRTGRLDPAVEVPTTGERDTNEVEIHAYPDEAAARADLEAESIQAYYIVPEDYFSTGRLQLVYWDDEPGEAARTGFRNFLRANLVRDLPPDVAARAVEGSEMRIRSADGQREMAAEDILSLFLPWLTGIMFFIITFSTGGYLMNAVADEKENRTMEIMMTSVSPEQFIGGKVLGLVGVAFTQLGIWILAIVIGLVVGAQFVPFLHSVRVPWDFVLLAVLFFVPSYFLVAGLSTAIGATVTEAREGQQVSGIINMLFTFPYFLVVLMFTQPDGAVAVAMTLFPTTALVTLSLRWSMTLVPPWQILLSLLLLSASAVLAVWAAARVFRVGMLRYGQRLRLAEVVRALRSRTSPASGEEVSRA